MVTCLFESHKKEWQKKNKPVWLCHLDPDLMYLSTCHTSLTEQIMQLFFLAHKGPWFLRASTCIISQRLIGTPVDSEVKLGKWNTVSSAKDASRKLARRNEYWGKTENSCLWRTEPETLNTEGEFVKDRYFYHSEQIWVILPWVSIVEAAVCWKWLRPKRLMMSTKQRMDWMGGLEQCDNEFSWSIMWTDVAKRTYSLTELVVELKRIQRYTELPEGEMASLKANVSGTPKRKSKNYLHWAAKK